MASKMASKIPEIALLMEHSLFAFFLGLKTDFKNMLNVVCIYFGFLFVYDGIQEGWHPRWLLES